MSKQSRCLKHSILTTVRGGFFWNLVRQQISELGRGHCMGNSLLVEVGGTHTRAHIGLPMDEEQLIQFNTANFSSLSCLLDELSEHLKLSLEDRQTLHVRMAGAGCFQGSRIASDHVSWLESEFCALEAQVIKAGFLSFVFYNDMVAAAAGGFSYLEQDDHGGKNGGPHGLVGVGTGFGTAVIYPANRRSFGIVSSEFGFSPISPSSKCRIRDVVSSVGLRRTLNISESNENLRHAVQDRLDKLNSGHDLEKWSRFIERLYWSVLCFVVSYKLKKVTITGGITRLLVDLGLISTDTIRAHFKNARIGSLQSILDDCSIYISLRSDLALCGLVEIGNRATLRNSGKVDTPFLLIHSLKGLSNASDD